MKGPFRQREQHVCGGKGTPIPPVRQERKYRRLQEVGEDGKG